MNRSNMREQLKGNRKAADADTDSMMPKQKPKMYAKGGKVRGCGKAKKGVKKAKMY